ncbi:MAG TPA: segregation/condensation protein A [Capsulimonadaceae bacterium]|nr:segregation/condensation protein A [Capsulimonadaceae bacterium]
MPSAELPAINLPVFEGPLDLLLHLIREHKLDIADIPITLVTDHYLAYLAAMEERNLTLAGEFFVMAATLLEIKSRMLLPKPPKDAVDEEEGEAMDPRAELAERLRDYERFQALVSTLQLWEEERSQLFFRGQADFGALYELPVEFGEVSAGSLLRALQRLLEEAAPGEHEITSVRRQKLTLRLAMRSLLGRVQDTGDQGLFFEEAFTHPLVRLEIVMTFLALLELLRQGKLKVKQRGTLKPIQIFAVPVSETESAGGAS